MIEVSTPIQAQSSLENVQEKPPDASVFGSDSRKSDKLGVFSKILEGLISKSKGKIPNSGGLGETLAVDNQDDGNEDGIAGKKSGKKLSQLGKTPFGSAEGSAKEAFFYYPEKTPQFQTFFNPFEAENADGLAERLLKLKKPAQNQVLSKENFLSQNLTEGLGKDAWDGAKILVGEDEGSLFSALTKGENRGGKKGAFDLKSAVNADTALQQFSGEKRPVSADQLPGYFVNAGESKDGRNQEGRGRKVRDKVNLEVRDFRTFTENNTVETAKTPVNAVLQAEKIDAEFRVELRGNNAPQESPGGKTPGGFEEALSRELKDHLSSDIVRQASIVLRNGGEGVIRLSLKPETLGNVKIRVEMTENKITGHIVVESAEAFKAFQRELPVLEKQFQDSGFSEAKLDMSFAGEGGNFSPESRRDFEEFQKFSQVFAASSYDAEAERPPSIGSGFTDGFEIPASSRTSVNMLV